MRPFSSKGGTHACWVKLPFLCLIAATLAFAMVTLIAPFASEAKIMSSHDDPSRQAIISDSIAVPLLERGVQAPRRVEEETTPSAKIEEEVASTAKVVAPKADGTADSRNSSQVVLQLPSQQEAGCNLFQGRWVEDLQLKPLYQNGSCPIMSQQQNCVGNGRPDSNYLNWKWKPAECHLPNFDALEFLELMRGKTLAFVGDSVTRNQYEALVCSLWQAATPVAHGNRKFQRWVFRKYDFKVIRLWSSWLVNVSTDAVSFAPKDLKKLHLDILDANIAELLPSVDALVVASGHWWGTKPGAYVVNGTQVVGGQAWWDDKYTKQHDTLSAYAIGIRTALKAITTHPGYKGVTIFRTYSPNHYDGGEWNTGGSCTGKSRPLADAELSENAHFNAIHAHQIAAFEEASSATNLLLMDIAAPFRYRADGHPGPYRSLDPHQQVAPGKDGKPPPQDCLHWCMPGPVDTWNEYLLAMLRRHYRN